MGRSTQGVRVMNIKDDDRVSAVALVVESEDASAGDGNGSSPPAADELPEAEAAGDGADLDGSVVDGDAADGSAADGEGG
jgi:DNA gyrase subunit A